MVIYTYTHSKIKKNLLHTHCHMVIYIQVNHIYSTYSFRSTNTSKSHLHMQNLSITFEHKWCINQRKTPTFFQSKKSQISLFELHKQYKMRGSSL